MYFNEPFTSELEQRQQLIVAPAPLTVSSEEIKTKSLTLQKEIKRIKKFGGWYQDSVACACAQSEYSQETSINL